MPPKVAYKRLATDEDLEFEFFLASELGMTVGQMRDEMDNDEFVHWAMYYARKSQQQELANQRR
jgi:hypothetical protein